MAWKNQGGGPWGPGPKGPWGSGPQSSGPTPPDLEELIRRGQDKMRTLIPGGGFNGLTIVLIGLGLLGAIMYMSLFRVQPDELGAVMRFGKHVRTVQPGLNTKWPYPIETVSLPKALRVNTMSIGASAVADGSTVRRGGARSRPEESLMLTGDENIVDIDFTVLWRIKLDGIGEFLFNIQNPEGTVKAVAESAMREVVGRSNIQPILTGARSGIESAVLRSDAEDARRLQSRHPDHAGSVAEGRSADAGRSMPSATCRRRAPISSVPRTKRRPTPTAFFPRRAVGRHRSRRLRKPIANRPSPKPRVRPRAS